MPFGKDQNRQFWQKNQKIGFDLISPGCYISSMTRQDFEDTIRRHYPAKWINTDVDPVTADVYVFALDTQAECRGSFSLKLALADYIYNASSDTVTKDQAGIFTTIQMNTNGVLTLPTGFKYSYQIIGGGGSGGSGHIDGWKEIPNKRTPKCECGAVSVGSNRHSSWCEMENVKCGA